MTEASSNLPIAIDYTSRDFYALRTDLIARVKANLPAWSGNDPADIGVAIIEAVAYMGDIANYYIDRVANESFLQTATQRSTLLGYAKSKGYSVSGYKAATTTLVFGNSKTSSLTLPAQTVVYVDLSVNGGIKRVKFTTDEEVTIPASTALGDATAGYSSYSVAATEGMPIGNAGAGLTLAETVDGISYYPILVSATSGQLDQTYKLADNNVIDDSLRVYIKSGSTYVKWTKVSDLTLYGKSDKVYTTFIDENNYINIFFGDGVSGLIPSSSSTLWAAYSVGDGIYGNMAAGTILSTGSPIQYIPSGTLSDYTPYISLTNSFDSLGGADPESNDSIRYAASAVAKTSLRAVTLQDYESIALRTSNIGKVKAYSSSSYSSVTLYVAPRRLSTLPSDYSFVGSDIYPGYDLLNSSITNEMTTLKSDVEKSLVGFTQIGVTTTVTEVSYTPVNLAYSYILVDGYTDSEVSTRIKTQLLETYSYNNSKISDSIYYDAIVKTIVSVEGVASASVTILDRNSGTNKTNLVGTPGEIFVFTSNKISGTVATSFSQSVLEGLWLLYHSTTITSTSYTFASGVTTLTTTANHGLSTGDKVRLTGFGNNSYNATWTVAAGSGTTTLKLTTTTDLGATGTLTSAAVRQVATATPVTEPFDSTVRSYLFTTSGAYGVLALPVCNDGVSTITFAGGTVATGTLSGLKSVNVGYNYFSLVVTNTNSNIRTNYDIVVIRS